MWAIHCDVSAYEAIYASKVLKTEAITAARDNLSLLNLENLGVGYGTWVCLAGLQELEPFFLLSKEVLSHFDSKNAQEFRFWRFNVEGLGNWIKLHHIQWKPLAKWYPQIRSQMLNHWIVSGRTSRILHSRLLHQQCIVLLILHREAKSWYRVETLEGQNRFNTPCKFMYGILDIVCSNADSERGFSILRKIHTNHSISLPSLHNWHLEKYPWQDQSLSCNIPAINCHARSHTRSIH